MVILIHSIQVCPREPYLLKTTFSIKPILDFFLHGIILRNLYFDVLQESNENTSYNKKKDYSAD